MDWNTWHPGNIPTMVATFAMFIPNIPNFCFFSAFPLRLRAYAVRLMFHVFWMTILGKTALWSFASSAMRAATLRAISL